ncbi:MAG: [FeFe] hydrogenase H-cluster radical SAM maturase HydE, partial [Eubacteriales bacterium]|nr:[FeFe] hydrogenase H-cluster radical SAM maturase HydE [Eubacteriales bacterium]
YPDCAITLSLGERTRESYQRLYDAGANRYLLRHETANEAHYGRLHPPELSWKHRMECLKDLRAIGYQTGCGMMIGSPYQTAETLAEDMLFMAAFRPQMIGLGPFIPAAHTPFADRPAGTLKDTLFFLSLCRLMLPDVLLPATTALGTIAPHGRALGILAGANVVMPNLSPTANRGKYLLYDHKIGTTDEVSDGRAKLEEELRVIGYTIREGRGDYETRLKP